MLKEMPQINFNHTVEEFFYDDSFKDYPNKRHEELMVFLYTILKKHLDNDDYPNILNTLKVFKVPHAGFEVYGFPVVKESMIEIDRLLKKYSEEWMQQIKRYTEETKNGIKNNKNLKRNFNSFYGTYGAYSRSISFEDTTILIDRVIDAIKEKRE